MSTQKAPIGSVVRIVVYGEVTAHDGGSVELENGSLIDPGDIESITVIDDEYAESPS